MDKWCCESWRYLRVVHDEECRLRSVSRLAVARAVSDLAREISAVGPLALRVLNKERHIFDADYGFAELEIHGFAVLWWRYAGPTRREIAANLAATERE